MLSLKTFSKPKTLLLILLALSFLPSSLHAEAPLEGVEDIEELELGALLGSPVVEAASKRSQSLHEAPATVQVLRSEDFSPHAGLADIFRSAIGVEVVQTNARAFNVGIRGINRLLNNRVLTLVDGRAIADSTLGAVFWGVFPLDVIDIEQIEILRGPGSTLYGADALNGVISVSSMRPIDHPGTRARLATGLRHVPGVEEDEDTPQHHFVEAAVSHSWRNQRETLGLRVGGLFEGGGEWEAPADEILAPHEEKYGDFRAGAQVAFDWAPSEDRKFEADLLFNTAEFSQSLPAAKQSPHFFMDVEVLQLGYSDAFFDSALDLDVETYASRNTIISEVMMADIEEKRAGLSGQVHWQIHEDNFFTFGVEGAYLDVNNFFSNEFQQIRAAVLTQNEAQFLDDSLLLTLGLRAELVAIRSSLDDIEYRNLNPRGSLVWRFVEDQDLRLSVATAYRTPSAFETISGVTAAEEYKDSTPDVRIVAPNPSLHPEEVLGFELGYRGDYGQKIRLDLTLFLEEITQLIGLARKAGMPMSFKNLDSFTRAGAELGIRYVPHPSFSCWSNLSLQGPVEADEEEPWDEMAPVLTSIGFEWRHELLRAWMQFYGAFGARPYAFGLDSESMTLSRGPRRDITQLDLGIGHRLFDDFELSLSGLNLLAFLYDDTSALQQYPIGANRIGASVILGVSFTPWEE